MRRNSDNIKYDKFYHSKEFEIAKDLTYVKYQGIDLYDYYIKKLITPAKICHHIVPLKEDWNIRCEWTNLFYSGSLSTGVGES